MPVTIVLRGFKVSVPTLDAFLAANGLDETYGAPPFYHKHPDHDPISQFFHSKLGVNDPDKKTRLIIPQRRDMDYSTVTYVAYTWIMVYAHRELPPNDDGDDVPAGFEGLRREILGFAGRGRREEGIPPLVDEGRMGQYVVFTEEGNFKPPMLIERGQFEHAACNKTNSFLSCMNSLRTHVTNAKLRSKIDSTPSTQPGTSGRDTGETYMGAVTVNLMTFFLKHRPLSNVYTCVLTLVDALKTDS